VKKMTEKGCKVTFNKSGLKVFLEGNTVATGQLSKNGLGSLYVLNGEPCVQEDFAHVAQTKNGIEHWHNRLGHVSPEKLVQMTKEGLVNDLQLVRDATMSFRETCQFGKQPRNPFPKEAIGSSKILELIHSDVCGPMPVSSVGGN